ncbi:hypothetical protein U1Q18_040453, partial [Sarracenia purpurea var. burkii]
MSPTEQLLTSLKRVVGVSRKRAAADIALKRVGGCIEKQKQVEDGPVQDQGEESGKSTEDS